MIFIILIWTNDYDVIRFLNVIVKFSQHYFYKIMFLLKFFILNSNIISDLFLNKNSILISIVLNVINQN